jgi:hypothetical protein
LDSSTSGQLNRDSAARAEGTQRTNDYGRVSSGSGSAPRTGSYRPSGATSRGGSVSRGGGGRRR